MMTLGRYIRAPGFLCRRSACFQACSPVGAVTEVFFSVLDYIPEIQTDSKVCSLLPIVMQSGAARRER